MGRGTWLVAARHTYAALPASQPWRSTFSDDSSGTVPARSDVVSLTRRGLLDPPASAWPANPTMQEPGRDFGGVGMAKGGVGDNSDFAPVSTAFVKELAANADKKDQGTVLYVSNCSTQVGG